MTQPKTQPGVEGLKKGLADACDLMYARQDMILPLIYRALAATGQYQRALSGLQLVMPGRPSSVLHSSSDVYHPQKSECTPQQAIAGGAGAPKNFLSWCMSREICNTWDLMFGPTLLLQSPTQQARNCSALRASDTSGPEIYANGLCSRCRVVDAV